MVDQVVPFTSERLFTSVSGCRPAPTTEAIAFLLYPHSRIGRKAVVTTTIPIAALLGSLFRVLSVLLFFSFAAPAHSQVTTIDFQDYSNLTTCDRHRPPPLGRPCVN